METIEFRQNDRLLFRLVGGFLDPFFLVPFGEENAASSRLEARGSLAYARFREAGISEKKLELVRVLLALLSQVDEGPYQREELSRAGLSLRSALQHRIEPGGLSYEVSFDYIDLDFLLKTGSLERPELILALRGLWLIDTLRRPDCAFSLRLSEHVTAHLKAIWPRVPSVESITEAIDQLLSQLASCLASKGFELERSESYLTTALSVPPAGARTPFLQDLLEVASALPPFERSTVEHAVRWPTLENTFSALDALISVEDWSHVMGMVKLAFAVAPIDGSEGPMVLQISRWAKTLSESEELAHARSLLKLAVWRSPLRVDQLIVSLDDWKEREVLTGLGKEAALSLKLRDESWRPSGVALGRRLLDDGRVRPGLDVLRAASDISFPNESLLIGLRETLKDTYGISYPQANTDTSPSFLLTGPEGLDHKREISRLLFDGIAGAVYEPFIDNVEEREAFFKFHIAPALSYLDADPTSDGKRRHHPRHRINKESQGPGLGSVLLFLVALVFAIVLIGIAIRNHA